MGAPQIIVLPESDQGISFRLIRCSRLVLVVNDGSKSIVVRGRHLAPGGVMPLTNGQVVLLPSGPLSFEDFAFFLDCIQFMLHAEEAGFMSTLSGGILLPRPYRPERRQNRGTGG